jgi:hypothetical protein
MGCGMDEWDALGSGFIVREVKMAPAGWFKLFILPCVCKKGVPLVLVP